MACWQIYWLISVAIITNERKSPATMQGQRGWLLCVRRKWGCSIYTGLVICYTMYRNLSIATASWRGTSRPPWGRSAKYCHLPETVHKHLFLKFLARTAKVLYIFIHVVYKYNRVHARSISVLISMHPHCNYYSW